MAIKISTSAENQTILKRLTHLYGFSNETIIVRIAISYSLQLGKRFKTSDVGSVDSGGKILHEDVIFGRIHDKSNYVIYKTLLDQHYTRNLSETDFYKLLKLHMDHGLKVIGNTVLDNPKPNFHVDFLVGLVRKEMELIADSQILSEEHTRSDENSLPVSERLISFDLGETIEGQTVTIRLNDLKEFDSHHIAIAGMTGSGKTEFAKDILHQIHQKSHGELKFIFFDYKGEGRSEKLHTFLQATGCEFIDVLQDGFELNPLSYISLDNERLQVYNIRAFVDAVAAIETRLGALQKHTLQTVISRCFEHHKEKDFPSLRDVFIELQQYNEETNSKIDSLYTILEDLSRDIFRVVDAKDSQKIYGRNLYLSLPKTLSDTLRQITVFLTLNYLLATFNSCNDVTPDADRINPLRYIIVIDEAHVYLKNKNARKILEDLLRVIRSKGVVIIMISQGPADYKTPDFDFASQVKLPICLNINDKDYRLIKSFIGTPKSEHKLQEVIDGLDNGKAIINIKEPQLLSIRQFWRSIID